MPRSKFFLLASTHTTATLRLFVVYLLAFGAVLSPVPVIGQAIDSDQEAVRSSLASWFEEYRQPLLKGELTVHGTAYPNSILTQLSTDIFSGSSLTDFQREEPAQEQSSFPISLTISANGYKIALPVAGGGRHSPHQYSWDGHQGIGIYFEKGRATFANFFCTPPSSIDPNGFPDVVQDFLLREPLRSQFKSMRSGTLDEVIAQGEISANRSSGAKAFEKVVVTHQISRPALSGALISTIRFELDQLPMPTVLVYEVLSATTSVRSEVQLGEFGKIRFFKGWNRSYIKLPDDAKNAPQVLVDWRVDVRNVVVQPDGTNSMQWNIPSGAKITDWCTE